MAYERTTWEDGVTMVSADRLNNIESGLTTADTTAYNASLNLRSLKNNIIGADAYNSSTAYSAGDMCIYSNTAWKCLIACQDETPEEGTYWTQVSLKSLESLNKLEETELFWGSVTVGTTIDLPENVRNFRFIRIYEVDNQWMDVVIPITNDRPGLVLKGLTTNYNYSVMVLSEVDLETSNGAHYQCYRSSHMNIDSTGVAYFSMNQTYTLKIAGIR